MIFTLKKISCHFCPRQVTDFTLTGTNISHRCLMRKTVSSLSHFPTFNGTSSTVGLSASEVRRIRIKGFCTKAHLVNSYLASRSTQYHHLWETLLKPSSWFCAASQAPCTSAVPNIFGTRDRFCGRQFFHGQGRGDGSGGNVSNGGDGSGGDARDGE